MCLAQRYSANGPITTETQRVGFCLAMPERNRGGSHIVKDLLTRRLTAEQPSQAGLTIWAIRRQVSQRPVLPGTKRAAKPSGPDSIPTTCGAPKWIGNSS